MNRLVIRSLYKHKLKNCMKLGYVPGSWNDDYLYHDNVITQTKLRRLYKKGMAGAVIFNNIRYHYKSMKDIQNPLLINEYIDYGFHTLKSLNILTRSNWYQ